MTLIDKIGAVTAVVVFVLLAAAYFYSFRPKNKQKFEDLRNFVNDDDER
ncbi:cbb3-type cytochrome c oxidase subunit 3 [Candidatus Thioglobus sp.]|jgi:cbb3-type cytochrome oxidase subunit 3|nr:cbb3-type cytochrome c oxidase subunit 3 [Candidatus Thioglobus sp.]MDB3870135.1 cbb3-type cytochrome c oxidase subunit 3 [Candidatus Thioglobus sp.]MDB3893486.1 cbb3-type cytochrome c oxidase subunit 3 [Candidatus Thioglobus sp.]MDB3972185.1 cbb3-type cytochrome c oxidase subunit 3 [Candidatus Thioglobus sp.]MDC0390851.1 cbb3-type cytochrome c oxidase subunit 3 [Candidatus Thioglobus sp.]